MTSLTYYDVIIIGTGLAGLYAANQIKRLASTKSILILEKNNKHAIGGRAGNDMFYGTELAIGAGVGRKHKDHNLIQLLKQFKGKVHTSEFEATREYITPFQPVDINKTMKLLRSKYNSNPTMYKSLRFKDFFIKVLNEDVYRQFVITSGYTDYERADTYETLYKYGMDDNTRGGWTAIHVPWRELVTTLYENIGKENFKFSSEVSKIVQTNMRPAAFQVFIRGSQQPLYSNKLVVATTISGVKKLLQTIAFTDPLCNINMYEQIHAQPFLMVYAKFDKTSSELMKTRVKTFTVVSTQIQKLIPMNPDKGVYMIAYTDNVHATALKGRLENTRTNCNAFSKLVEEALGITGIGLYIISIKSYYWSEGTHYYDPLKPDKGFNSRSEFIRAVQNPCLGLAVVGEAVSRNQGWVEGALESVNAVITADWLHY
jgi:hypothetical protein